MVKTPVFWVMYLMFVLVAAGGLMATAQLGPIAKDFEIARRRRSSLLGLTLPALTFALSIDRVLNGVTRPFFGWMSDHIGRENTMFIAFALEGVGILVLCKFGHIPLVFVLLTGLVFFAWGEIYSLFPATCGDTFGSQVCRGQRRPALHRQRHGGAPGAVSAADRRPHRQLGRGVHPCLRLSTRSPPLLALLVLKPMRARLMEANAAETAMPTSRPVIVPAE